jgi:hypothetical protein
MPEAEEAAEETAPETDEAEARTPVAEAEPEAEGPVAIAEPEAPPTTTLLLRQVLLEPASNLSARSNMKGNRRTDSDLLRVVDSSSRVGDSHGDFLAGSEVDGPCERSVAGLGEGLSDIISYIPCEEASNLQCSSRCLSTRDGSDEVRS